ncbi:MAG: D-alanyl-D-alanine carboxypeptidase [Oscillospiraceae bacterium]|nr:D-alanyl-D-alanine carboxypeptidase [Oscillospiraceae bacterium]
MKKIFTVAVTLTALIITGLTPAYANNSDDYKLPDAAAFILMEAETGQILRSHNENQQLPMSSLAKIMTLLLIGEELQSGRISLTDDVPASMNAHKATGSVIWLNAGEVMKLDELLKSVVISSSNDATIALAEYVSGSTEAFTERMNQRAAELNLQETFFADCGGFDERSLSTASDIALMTAELFKLSGFGEIFGQHFTTRLSAVRAGTERETQLLNTNKLAHSYQGSIGGKAGQSAAAGFCIAHCAIRDGMKLIAVVLGAVGEDERVEIGKHVLSDGFRDFEFVTPTPDSENFSPVKVERGVTKTLDTAIAAPLSFVAPKGSGKNAKYIYTVPDSLAAPIPKGGSIGKVAVELDGVVVAEYDIVALYEVEELTFAKALEIMLEKFFRF